MPLWIIDMFSCKNRNCQEDIFSTFACLEFTYNNISTYSRSMIPEAVFREFSTETCWKRPVSGRNPSENVRNPVTVSDCRFCQVLDRFVHRNTASMKSSELSNLGLIWILSLNNKKYIFLNEYYARKICF